MSDFLRKTAAERFKVKNNVEDSYYTMQQQHHSNELAPWFLNILRRECYNFLDSDSDSDSDSDEFTTFESDPDRVRKQQEIRLLREEYLNSASSSRTQQQYYNVPFNALSDGMLNQVLQFVIGTGEEKERRRDDHHFARINKRCYDIYITYGISNDNFLFGYGPLSQIIDKWNKCECNAWEMRHSVAKGIVYCDRKDVLNWLLKEQDKYLLKGVCGVATKEGRTDLLDKVWNNVNEWDRGYIFERLERVADFHGKLDVYTNWLETKLLLEQKKIEEEKKKHATFGDSIIEWVKENGGLE
eukprot:CAMPEP_0178967300 /NCGR_PEP_ID=MMETSP0789-20121207/17501_1 /TAXON_ID=3005 /ORGANISM="Rhizosolenia setigera, Strain CCMP 1694" /LENGTH=298 /DNA_ID=CAMNT_0020652861 /DNA_START=66 /DNA_END=962 /DNA_ORIENTATION=-